jgi:pimeloyl-ACP methyl ester carboxylesterase
MPNRPVIVFACAHLCDERLFSPQIAALGDIADCRVMVFSNQSSMLDMSEHLLMHAPTRFSLIGLSLGGYIAFEVVRRALARLERLVLIDTTAFADAPARLQGRATDVAKVQAGGIDALIPELPSRWTHPDHAQHAPLTTLMASMARRIGADGQRRQQEAMRARPDSHADLRGVRIPTLIVCGREDRVTPVSDHQAMHDCVAGSELAIIEHCGHLSSLEQAERVSAVLRSFFLQAPRQP